MVPASIPYRADIRKKQYGIRTAARCARLIVVKQQEFLEFHSLLPGIANKNGFRLPFCAGSLSIVWTGAPIPGIAS